MYAAEAGEGDAVALLVSKVADVNIQDTDGMRAYDWARSGGNSELADFLGLITEDKKESNRNSLNKNSQKEEEKNRQKQIQNKLIEQ